MKANDDRLVPKHYASTYLHWDFVLATGQDYFIGNSTKYLARWRLKNGLEDLKKSLHYIDKLIEAAKILNGVSAQGYSKPISAEIDKFVEANKLFEREALAIRLLCTWSNVEDLVSARRIVNSIVVELEQPVPVSDSNKHATDTTGW